ncbi:hypothetical protein WEH80_19735 [Actinomycetes bacterium KLBMP 9759]
MTTPSVPTTRPTGALSTTLRIVVTIGALGVLAQALLAGQILAGTAGADAAHGLGGLVVVLISLAQLVIAVIAWRRGSVPARAAAISTGLFVAIVVQLFVGGSGLLAVHIPLGVLLFGGYASMLASVWQR